MSQQGQTLDYFRSAASGWQSEAENATGKYEVIEWRNRAVLDVIEQMPHARSFLDVGCGTGQLVTEAARHGLKAEGNDFAQEMIDLCETNAQGVDGVSFSCGSFFDTAYADDSFDVISAQGFIEYISQQELDRFLLRCSKMLKKDGALVLGSRNRLFNLASLNAYTKLELEFGTTGNLLAEAVILNTSATTQEMFQALRRYERIDPQPDRHPVTGIPVDTRYQYTPADLVYRTRKYGFTPKGLYPVHYHGLPSRVKEEHLDVHSRVALLAANLGPRDHRMVPFSSTFVIDVRKTES